MRRQRVTEWIRDAVAELGLPPTEAVLLPERDAVALVDTIGRQFVDHPTRTWWWEGLREPQASHHAADGRGCEIAAEVVPPECRRIFLIGSDDDPPPWPVFDVSRSVLAKLLSECPAFEYLLTGADHSWLVGENHHNVVFAVGRDVVERLNAYASN